MKITSFAHSCLLLEAVGKKILVDPGEYSANALEKNSAQVDCIFLTHKHGDHFNEALAKKVCSKETTIYATKETANFYPNTRFSIVKESDKIKLFEGIEVMVVKAVHGYVPLLKGIKEVHEAIGLIFKTSEKSIYVTGDTICFPNDYKCDAIFLPVNNHGVCMSPFEAALFAKETGAKIAYPYHLDSPRFPPDMKKVEEEFTKAEMPYKILKSGESIEV